MIVLVYKFQRPGQLIADAPAGVRKLPATWADSAKFRFICSGSLPCDGQDIPAFFFFFSDLADMNARARDRQADPIVII